MDDKQLQRRNVLGRGLSALIPSATEPGQRAGVLSLGIEQLERDQSQPRQHFDRAKLEELASSIRSQGVLQPILVRKELGKYKILAGERRWRAAQLAGLHEVPVIVREASAKEALEIALIENLQREDLNPIEEAEGYKRLIEEYQLTQEAVAQRVGRDRSTVSNALRLLALPGEVRQALIEGRLNMGHARALLGCTNAQALRRAALEVIEHSLSVRATEALVRKLRKTDAPKNGASRSQDLHSRDVVEKLQRALGAKVRLLDKSGKGKIEIDYSSYEELERITDKILN